MLSNPENPHNLKSLHGYLTAINNWMSMNFLWLNTDQTQVLDIGLNQIF